MQSEVPLAVLRFHSGTLQPDAAYLSQAFAVDIL